jgi:hypothetical protein
LNISDGKGIIGYTLSVGIKFETLITEMAVYLQVINTLVTGSYLKPSTKLAHISKTDRLLRFEASFRKEHKGIPTAKDIVKWKIDAEAKVKREDEEAEKIGMVHFLLGLVFFFHFVG